MYICPEAPTCSGTWSHLLTQPHPWNPKSYTHAANALVLFPLVGCAAALCHVGLCNGGSVRRKGRAAGRKSRERVTQLFTPAAEDPRDQETGPHCETRSCKREQRSGKVRNQGRYWPWGTPCLYLKARHCGIDSRTEDGLFCWSFFNIWSYYWRKCDRFCHRIKLMFFSDIWLPENLHVTQNVPNSLIYHKKIHFF